MARAVLLLIQVCNICKEIMLDAVKKEPWYALLDNLVATSNINQKRKGPRPFVTFVPNEKRELVQLTFDLSAFKREHRTEFILSDEVREILSILPALRPPEAIAKVIRCIKGLFQEFSNYPLEVQKAICQKAFYDKYRYNRVILKKGHEPDGIYFVLSGSLIEKHEIGRQPKEITTGAMFGENDLICGSKRRHTVLTRTDTELLYLHRQDYRVIFNMADDSNDPKNLEICKQDIVFQHFPMNRLVDNPGTWSVIKYKYGRLIAKDNREVDWIYVIKSGEARVFKYLHPGDIDVQARRKKVQAMKNAQSVFHIKKKILNFVEERDYIKSSYSPRKYHPSTRITMSAPPGQTRDRMLLTQNNSSRREVFTCIPGFRGSRSSGAITDRKHDARNSLDKDDGPRSRPQTTDIPSRPRLGAKRASVVSWKSDAENGLDSPGSQVRLPKLTLDNDDVTHKSNNNESNGDDNQKHEENHRKGGKDIVVEETIDSIENVTRNGRSQQRQNRDGDDSGSKTGSLPPSRRQSQEMASKTRIRSGSFIRTPNARGNQQPQVIQVGNHTLPAFVQVETLHPGQVFGLRSCLEPEERGPSVSLVSGECEILQINKKFFMKHCDDAIYSLIRLKAKNFPSKEDLIDRLDVNMQWEEYKQQTMAEFLQRSRKLER